MKREGARQHGWSWENNVLMSQDELMMVGDGGRFFEYAFVFLGISIRTNMLGICKVQRRER